VPTQDGAESYERGDFGEGMAAELLLEDPVLLTKILDDSILLVADPASERCDEDLPRLQATDIR
jgi:hypothetical protein